MAKLSRSDAEAAVALLDQHNGIINRAAKASGINRFTLADRLRIAKERYGIEPSPQKVDAAATERFEVSEAAGGSRRIWSVSDAICTVDEAVAKAGIDLAIWEVVESHVSQHQCPMKMHRGHAPVEVGDKLKIGRVPDESRLATMWNVRVLLRRRAPKHVTDALDEIHKRAERFSPRYKFPKLPKTDGDLMAVPCLFDHHFGKLCWRQETGNDYDLKIATTIWSNALNDLLAYVEPLGVKLFYFPIGQDLVNFDNVEGSTTAGTPQDNDGRYAKVIDTAYWSLVEAVDRFASMAKVEAEYVAGNHDLTVSYHLCRELKRHYRHTDRVEVGIDFRKRKYKRHGVNLIGTTHAENVPRKWDNLPTIMATEAAEDWAATVHHEWLLGHEHTSQKRETLPVMERSGVICRTMRSLSGQDFWHYDKGYLSKRAAEVYLYSASRGYVGQFSVNARET